MKIILFFTALTLLTSSFSFASQDTNPPEPKKVHLSINNVYIPEGFTSSSKVYVVINGIFPNGCYRWDQATVTDKNEFTHEIRAFASVTPGMCIMVLIPYQKEIQIGTLSAGKHLLRFINGDDTYIEKELTLE